MNRTTAITLGSFALVLVAFIAFPLWAQPTYPTSPSGKSASIELVVPPGIYQTFVFAADGTSQSVARAVLKTPSGELTITARGGETVVVPLANWSLSQQASLTISEGNGVSMTVGAITVAGPVNFAPAKK